MKVKKKKSEEVLVAFLLATVKYREENIVKFVYQ